MGIANIINTSTSSGGGGGEIIRELVNSSDGQGLYFSNTGYIHLANNAAVEFGTSDFSIEFILNQTGEAGTSGGSIYQSATTVNNKFSIENHVSSNVVKLIFFNSVGAASQYDLSYNMAADYNEPTHYVVSCDRSGNAVLYRNGTEVASVAIAASASTNLGDGVTSTAMIGNSGSGYTFLGGLYRFRTWSKALTHDEVDTCFQRADVPFADQYGSQTELSSASFTNSGFTGFSGSATGFTASGSANGNAAYKNQTFTDGKKFRIKFTVTDGESANLYFNFRTSSGGGGSNTGNIISSSKGVASSNALQATETGDYEVIVDSLGSAASYRFVAAADIGAVNISGFSIVQIGCLTDVDLAFSNPSQSLMIQDRAGNSDGTMGGTIQQTQKIVQLNSTSAVVASSAFTPTDGHIATDCLTLPKAGGTPSLSFDYGSVYNLLDGAVTTSQETTHLAGRNIAFHVNANTANAMTIDSAGLVTVNGGDLKLKAPAGNQTDAELLFESPNNSSFGSTFVIDSKILSTANSTTNAYGSRLKFFTNNDSNTLTERMSIDSAGKIAIGNNVPMWSGSYGGALVLKGNNASSDRHAQLSIVDSTGSIVQDGLRVTSAGAVQVLSDGGNNNPAHLSLWAKDTSIAGGDVIGSLLGQGSDSATSPPLTGAKINFTADHAWDGSSANYQSTRIDFFTQSNTGSDTLDLPRMSIANNGVVTIKRKTSGGGTGANTTLTLGIDDLPAGTDMAAGDGTRLLFKIPAADTNKVGASIDAIRAEATDADSSTDLRFMVSQNDETLDTAMTISSAGAVSVTNGNMTVKKSTGVGNTTLKVENDNSGNAAVLELEGKRTGDNDSSQIQFSNSGEIISAIKAYRSGANDAGKLELFTSASGSSGLTTRMQISSGGLCTFTSGIAFSQTNTSATGASATSTTLNHFESGTWTPVFKGGSSAGSYSAGATVARYTRIGNVVSVLCSLINITESSAGSGSIEVSGLPFTSANISTQANGTGSVRLRSYTSSGSSVMAYVPDNSASVLFSQYVSGSADSHVSITGLSSGSSDLTFTLTYFV